MATAARRLLALGAISAALLGGASAAAHALAAPTDFTVLLVRSSVSASDATVVLQGKLSSGAAELGLQPKIVIVAAVSQTCVASDGSTTVEQAVLDSVTAPHFFTTTVRLLDNGAADSTWQATVVFTTPADASICGPAEQPAGTVSVDSLSGAAFLSSLGVGSPPAGTRIYSFVLDSGRHVLVPPQLTFIIA